MKIAIHQPNFLPWIGYFHKINSVDKFVFLDDVQLERGKTYTKRTKVLVQGNEQWLTIPIINQSDLIKINEASVEKSFFWKKKHLKTLELNYKKHPAFNEVFSIIETIYNQNSQFLIDYNIPLITGLSKYLNINTKFVLSSDLDSSRNQSGENKILEINKELNATIYVSGKGKGSVRYIKEEDYIIDNIQLEWQNYSHKYYTQFNTNIFIPGLSIIDLLFNHGKNSIKYIDE